MPWPSRRQAGAGVERVWIVLFVLGAAVSLAGSYVLVTRLERLGERAGMSVAVVHTCTVTGAVILEHRGASPLS